MSFKNEPHKTLSFAESFCTPLLHNGQEPQVYAHQWRTGDLVIWDNRICLHSAPKKKHI
jgi:alpha-ketoglutarate-dependent taurine dioxygenase